MLVQLGPGRLRSCWNQCLSTCFLTFKRVAAFASMVLLVFEFVMIFLTPWEGWLRGFLGSFPPIEISPQPLLFEANTIPLIYLLFKAVSLFLAFCDVIMWCLDADFFSLVCLAFIGLLEYGLMASHQFSPIISLQSLRSHRSSSHLLFRLCPVSFITAFRRLLLPTSQFIDGFYFSASSNLLLNFSIFFFFIFLHVFFLFWDKVSLYGLDLRGPFLSLPTMLGLNMCIVGLGI